MNILFVANDYPERGKPTTGFPNYLYRVSLALIELGHKPMILAAGNSDSHRTEWGIKIRTVKVAQIYGEGFQTVKYVYNAQRMGFALNREIRKIIREMHIDVIQFTSIMGLATLYYGKTPAVLRLSSYAKTYFSSYQTYSQKHVMAMSLFERMSAKRCNVIFAPCKNTADAFGKDCHRKVNVIETPFVNDVQIYDECAFDKHLRGKKYVLFFGTLYAEKGVFVIGDILEQFLQNNPDYYFVFIGHQYELNDVKADQILYEKAGKCAQRVIILKPLPHNRLYPIISHADFVVLPSLMDNLPNTCIEAMYFGRVVIGTDGASFEQLITHGKSGLLCRIGDSKDLLEKMQTALSMTEEEKQQMGKLARKRIDRLKPEYAVRELLCLYEYVIKKCKNERTDTAKP